MSRPGPMKRGQKDARGRRSLGGPLMLRRDEQHAPRSGFTLIELVITIAVLGVISGVFVHYVGEGARMFRQVDARRVLTARARTAVLRTMREVRQVRSGTDVLVATPSQMSFQSVDDSTYTISWNGSAGTPLMFSRGGSAVALVSAVDSLAFTYTKADGQPAAPVVGPAVTDIYRVGFYLRLCDGADTISVRSGTWLRNVP